jgi:hypothetical protein
MFTRHKSRRSRAIDVLTKYLKLKAAGKAAKGAVKVAKWTTAAKVAKAATQRVSKKGLLATAGGVGAAALVARKRRSATPTAA